MAENEGVIPQSPSGAEPEATPDPAGQSGSQGGRSIDNVYGEFSRKYSKIEERLEGLYQGIEAITQKLGSAPAPQQAPAPPAQQFGPGPVSPFGAPRPLAHFSDEHIEAYLRDNTLTPYQRNILETEKVTRNQAKLANQIWDQRAAQERLASTKSQAEQAAMAAFPALRDSASEFSQKVKVALQQRRSQFGEFPTDVYDVANAVSREMGLGETRAVTPSTFTASGFQDNQPRPASKPRRNELNDADVERISSRLANALPSDRQADGKMTRRKFNTKRLKERSKMYSENADLYRHTKLGGDE